MYQLACLSYSCKMAIVQRSATKCGDHLLAGWYARRSELHRVRCSRMSISTQVSCLLTDVYCSLTSLPCDAFMMLRITLHDGNSCCDS